MKSAIAFGLRVFLWCWQFLCVHIVCFICASLLLCVLLLAVVFYNVSDTHMDDVFTFCTCTTVVTLVLLALVLYNRSCPDTDCVGVSTVVAMTFGNCFQYVVHLMNMMNSINFFCHIRRPILFNYDPLIILSFPLFFSGSLFSHVYVYNQYYFSATWCVVFW